MKNEFIKRIEKCEVEGCLHCSRCAEVNPGEERNPATEARINSGLYEKEVEQYYFYFLRNKAS